MARPGSSDADRHLPDRVPVAVSVNTVRKPLTALFRQLVTDIVARTSVRTSSGVRSLVGMVAAETAV